MRLYIWLLKWGIWLAYWSGIRKWHVRFMAWLHDRKYKDVPIRIYRSIEELAQTILDANSYYRPDDWKRLWDSISYPGRFQAFLDNGGPRNSTANDCDDFANYIAHALKESDLPNVSNIRLLVVFWLQNNHLPNGHAVCLFESNGKYGYMDYGYPTYRDSIEDIVQHIVQGYNGVLPLVWVELELNTLSAKVITRN